MGDILLWGRLGDGKPVVPQDHKAPAQSISDLNRSVLKALAGRYAAGNIRDADICGAGMQAHEISQYAIRASEPFGISFQPLL